MIGRGAAAMLFAVGALAACGDSGGSSNPSDVVGSDSVSFGDTTGTTDTNSSLIDTVGATDTTPAPDTTPATDTAVETDTNTSPVRICTDDELNTFNACYDACGNTATGECENGCFNGLSTGCNAAFMAWINCANGAGCTDDATFAECVVENCPDETTAVYGSGELEPTDCNPVTNAGCTDTTVCTFINNAGDLGCAPKNDVPVGGDCSDSGLCSTGSCLTTDGGETFQCFAFCDTNTDCPNGLECNIGMQGSDYTLCGAPAESCDVLTQTCPGTEGCYFTSQQGDMGCYANTGGVEGSTCSAPNDCAKGLTCAGNPGKCMKFCATDGSVACTTGTCTALGIGTYGVCVVQ